MIEGVSRDWKRESDHLELEFQVFVSCRHQRCELNPGPLEEEPVLLISEPPLLPGHVTGLSLDCQLPNNGTETIY